MIPEPLRVGRYRIAPELFSRGYARGCGPASCSSACCKRGAYVDLGERDLILKHAQAIALEMDDSQSRDPASWFESDQKPDADYASGACVGTGEHAGKCAFLDRLGRCSLQVTENALGARKWSLKPLYCALFPIEVVGDVVRLDPRFQGREPCCSVKSPFDVPAFEACREELVYLLGDAGFAALRRHASDGVRLQP